MKTVKNVKNSLKFKAQPKDGLLTVRVGVKKYVLPVEARMIAGGDYLFLSFPATSEIYKIESEGLTAMDPEMDAGDASTMLSPGRRRRTRRASSSIEMTEELESALKSIPPGFRLGQNADGSFRLVKTRNRRKG